VLATAVLLYLAFFPDFITEFWIFIGLGIMSIWAAISYTIGKKPYGYLGLGDIMVFIFFGLLSVGGSYFLFTKTWNWDILLPASAFESLAVGCSTVDAVSFFSSPSLPLFEAVTPLVSVPVPVVPCTSSAFTPCAVPTAAIVATVAKTNFLFIVVIS